MGNISSDMKSLCEDIAAAHADRKRGIKELRERVTSLREGFRKKERDIRSDLKEASRIWNEMNETLKAKKTKHRR